MRIQDYLEHFVVAGVQIAEVRCTVIIFATFNQEIDPCCCRSCCVLDNNDVKSGSAVRGLGNSHVDLQSVDWAILMWIGRYGIHRNVACCALAKEYTRSSFLLNVRSRWRLDERTRCGCIAEGSSEARVSTSDTAATDHRYAFDRFRGGCFFRW